MISVLVVSPIPALRAGLRALLSGDTGFTVATAAALPESLEPGAGVLVITPGAVTAESAEPPEGWAVLLVGDEIGDLRALAEGRAWGILSAGASPEALQAAVRALAEGLLAGTPELMEQVLREAAPPPLLPGGVLDRAAAEENEAPLERLTEREVEVLRLAAQGLTNKQIALSLRISEHTVKFHISAVFSKLGVSNRAEAVRKGARLGYIPL